MTVSAFPFIAYALVEDFSIERLIFYTGEAVLNILLLQSWIPSSAVYFSLNAVAWYLSVCLFLYAAFPYILDRIKKLSSARAAVVCIAVIYLLQIATGFISRYIEIPIPYFDNFPKWMTYINPLFRTGDFAIGCLLGYIFLHKENNLGTKRATALEICVIILSAASQYFYYRADLFTGSEWFRYAQLYTPISVGLVYIFAVNKGLLSKILSCKAFVHIGNISALTFLIHQMVIRYIAAFSSGIIGTEINPWLMFLLAFTATIISAEVYMRIEKILNRGRLQ